MERLVQKRQNGLYRLDNGKATEQDGLKKLYDYENTGLSPEEITKLNARMPVLLHQRKQLAEYLKSEEQGLLKCLPCKVGDTVYEIETDHNALTHNDGTNIEEIEVDGFNIYENSIFFTADDESYAASGENSCINKTVFLTKEAAEAALNGGGVE